MVRSFEVAKRGWFTLFNLVTITNPSIQTNIEEELERAVGAAVINVQIVGQTIFVEVLIPVGMTIAGTLLGQVRAPDPYLGLTKGTASRIARRRHALGAYLYDFGRHHQIP